MELSEQQRDSNQIEELATSISSNVVPEEASPVKEKSWYQREALPGEPRCVVCGRFAEYICDETDDDICSMECKHVVISRLQLQSRRPAALSSTQVKINAVDECFYIKEDTLKTQALNSFQVESLSYKMDLSVKGDRVPPPILSFSINEIPHKLQCNLEAAGYIIPTPVQMQTIPAALLGRNLLVFAETGSGKTACFLIPLISCCSKIRSQNLSSQKKPLAIVLAPTRELCAQTEELAKLLAKDWLPFKTALVVGGNPMAGQTYRIEQGIELIIGTPGRMVDLLTKHEIGLNDVCLLDLDEVDSMFQRGFRDQVMQIIASLASHQLWMFSATLSQDVEKVAGSLAKDLIRVSGGKPSKPSEAIKQVVIWVETKHKKKKLFDILTSKQHFKPPVVVFVGSKVGADMLAEAIHVMTGLRAVALHGEKTMGERRENLKLFLTGEVPVIVATGVLGRGMDLLKVSQVIIFDMPRSLKEYVHQIGRASKLGSEGTAIVFINEENKSLFREFIDILKSSGAPVPRELAYSPYAQVSRDGSGSQKKRKHVF